MYHLSTSFNPLHLHDPSPSHDQIRACSATVPGVGKTDRLTLGVNRYTVVFVAFVAACKAFFMRIGGSIVSAKNLKAPRNLRKFADQSWQIVIHIFMTALGECGDCSAPSRRAVFFARMERGWCVAAHLMRAGHDPSRRLPTWLSLIDLCCTPRTQPPAEVYLLSRDSVKWDWYNDPGSLGPGGMWDNRVDQANDDPELRSYYLAQV